MKKIIKLALIVSSIVTVSTLSSCVPAAAAAGGYLYSEAQQ